MLYLKFYNAIIYSFLRSTFGDFHVDSYSFDGIVSHHADYVISIFLRYIHEREVVENIDTTD